MYEDYLITFEGEDLEREQFIKNANYWLDYIQPKLIMFNHLEEGGVHPLSPDEFHPELFVCGELDHIEIDTKGIKARFTIYETLPNDLKDHLRNNLEKWSDDVEELHNYWLKLVKEKYNKGILGFSTDSISHLIKRVKNEGEPTQIKSWAIPFASLTHIAAEPRNTPDARNIINSKGVHSQDNQMDYQNQHNAKKGILPKAIMDAMEPVVKVLKETLEISDNEVENIIFNLIEQKKILADMPQVEDMMEENLKNQEDVENEDVNEETEDNDTVSDDDTTTEYKTDETQYVKQSDLESFAKHFAMELLNAQKEEEKKKEGTTKKAGNTTKGMFWTSSKSRMDQPKREIETDTPLIDSINAIKNKDVKAMKAMGINPASSGGYMVQPEYSQSVIDLLQTKSIFLNGGEAERLVRFYPMASDTLMVPVMTGAGTAYWVGENKQITSSEASSGQRMLVAKKLAMLIPVSNELLRDSIPAFESTLRSDMAKVLANSVDQAILTGQGGLAPLGIVNQTGVNITELNAAPTYSNLVDTIQRLETANVDMNDSVRWIFNPVEKATFRKMKDSANHYIWTDTDAITRTGQAGEPSQLVGHKWISSNNVLAGTNGNTTSERNIFFGKWDEVIVGMRQELEIRASDEAGNAFEYDQTYIRAILRMDVVLAHPEGIEVLADVQV